MDKAVMYCNEIEYKEIKFMLMVFVVDAEPSLYKNLKYT